MEFEEVVRLGWWPLAPAGRLRTVRDFLDLPVEPAVVERIVDCGRRGPSAGFSQGSEFLVLEGPEQTEPYWDANPGPAGLRRAPLLIVLLAHQQAYLDRYAEADKGWYGQDQSHWPVPYWLVDTSFAGLLMLLAAVDQGLGAALFDIADVDGFRLAFGVPAEYFPIGTIGIGHPGPAG